MTERANEEVIKDYDHALATSDFAHGVELHSTDRSFWMSGGQGFQGSRERKSEIFGNRPRCQLALVGAQPGTKIAVAEDRLKTAVGQRQAIGKRRVVEGIA